MNLANSSGRRQKCTHEYMICQVDIWAETYRKWTHEPHKKLGKKHSRTHEPCSKWGKNIPGREKSKYDWLPEVGPWAFQHLCPLDPGGLLASHCQLLLTSVPSAPAICPPDAPEWQGLYCKSVRAPNNGISANLWYQLDFLKNMTASSRKTQKT